MDSHDAARTRYGVTIDAPVAQVWQVVAEDFDRVGEWATAVRSSSAVADGAGGAHAAVQGRVCTTGLPGIAHVEERIVAFDEVARTLTYEAHGMPGWIGTARNTWHMAPLGEHRTQAWFDPHVQSAGLLGRVMVPLFMLVAMRMAGQVLSDLKHWVEQGQPSPRKRRSLRRANRVTAVAKRRY